MGNIFFFQWEVDLIVWFQSWIGDFGVKLASLITEFGGELIMVLIMAFCYLCYDKAFGKKLGLAILFSGTVFPLIKNVFLRQRPYMASAEVKCLKPVYEGDIYDPALQGYSFPSGHTVSSFAAYSSLMQRIRRKWSTIVFSVLIVLVGVSRFCLGVHYPTDVLAGWVIAIVTMVFLGFILRKVKNEGLVYLILILIALPGWFYCRSNDYYSYFGLLTGFSAAMLYEKKYVNFTITRNPLRMVLRTLGAAAIFVALNSILKLPFSEEFLESATYGEFTFRAVRYAVIIFIIAALYPYVFRIWDKKEKKSGCPEQVAEQL